MKINILNGLVLIGALSIASCSTQKLASNGTIEDDVYNTKARAGDKVDLPPPTYREDVYTDEPETGDGQYYDSYGNGAGSDYYYYDSYASRINRFGYSSPFNFYDDYYYGYSPYGYGYGNGWNVGLGIGYGYGGFGYGGYYGYTGYGFGLGYGLGYPYGYYGYSPLGVGYGGGYPFWGVYSAYANTPRPYRGSGAPGFGGLANRLPRTSVYNGAYPGVNAYPGRPVGVNGYRGRGGVGTNGYGNRVGTNAYGGNNNNYGGRGNGNGNNGYGGMRAPRTDNQQPQYQPRTSNSFPSDGGSRGGGSAPASSGGGGGGRPGRP
ncbi:hypothetical protein [Mucilaginibacter ginkgonis]|uniref:Uncharacterized protein n=1 Tax=Mucilaginibacter ginkgonis TaxID=2682091 RepID=A0A6I4HWB4_9SPHI|nr:hypothetical protein [Mucilaginibacter ginkgonis]QQL50992.1 hypothetical protein GO620_005945 [Mucilaginibacter ginkgonis]